MSVHSSDHHIAVAFFMQRHRNYYVLLCILHKALPVGINSPLSSRVQFRLSELELTVVRQLWSVVLADPTLLASADFDVDDRLDIKPPGLLTV